MSNDHRDEELGAELRRLDVPDHGPEFFPQLAHRLKEEAANHPGSRRRPVWQRPPTLLTATAAVAAAVLAAIVVLPGSDDGAGNGSPALVRPAPGPEVRLISAGEVRSRVATSLASLRTLGGEVRLTCEVPVGDCLPPDAGGRFTLRWSFQVTAEGHERLTALDRPEDISYNAERGEQRAMNPEFGPAAQVVTGLPPGPPDFAARPSVLRRDVAAVVRAFLATTSDDPVTEVIEDGRPAWRLVASVPPNTLAGPGGSGDRIEVVVDRESGFPLRIVETLEGRFLYEVRLSDLVVDGPVDPGAFVLDLPGTTTPSRRDVGFRRVALAQLATAVGYRPVLPSPDSLPPGFDRAEITVAAQAQPTGTEGANPPSRDVVSVAYRRGFDRIVVTTRATGAATACSAAPLGSGTTACWADPLASGEGFVDQPERFTVAGGALTGARAELVISPRGVPHVWSVDDRLVVTVAGDATAEELRRMASSFSPAG